MTDTNNDKTTDENTGTNEDNQTILDTGASTADTPVLTDTPENTPTPDYSDTADNNESIKNKGGVTNYKCSPATVYTMHKSGEPMNSYRIIGNKLPKVGDKVCLSWNKTKFNGTVVEFTSEDVIRLRKSK